MTEIKMLFSHYESNIILKATKWIIETLLYNSGQSDIFTVWYMILVRGWWNLSYKNPKWKLGETEKKYQKGVSLSQYTMILIIGS